MSDDEIEDVTGDRSDPSWLGFASLGLLFVALVAAVRRSSDLDELSIPELPGVVGGLFLAVLVAATLPTRRPTAPRTRTATAAIVWAPIGAACAHTLAWWAGDALYGAASSLMAVALVAFLAAWIPERSRSGPLTVPQLGAMVAIILLGGNLALEVIDSFDDGPSTPDVVDATAPGLGMIAVVTGMMLVERGLRTEPRAVAADAAGTFQFALAGVGWAALVAGSAWDDLSLLVTSVGLHLLATITFMVRLSPVLIPAVAARTSARWSALALISAAVYVGLLVHVVVGFADSRYADAAAFPLWLETAVDVTSFFGLAASGLIGVMMSTRAGTPDFVVGRLAFALFVSGMIGAVLVGAARQMPLAAAISFGMLGLAIALVGWALAPGSADEVAERPW